MKDTCDVRLELGESGPSRFEWGLAFVLFIVPFMSFLYADPTAFLLYELKFAQAILHGSLREAYEPAVKVLSANGWSISTLSLYDLPLNLVFGVWGIPLYLWCSRGGTLEMNYPESFPQMLYAKSAMLAAFLFSAVLVYKVCRTVKLDSKRSGWGAYIYFTSSIATSAIGIIRTVRCFLRVPDIAGSAGLSARREQEISAVVRNRCTVQAVCAVRVRAADASAGQEPSA